MNRALSIALPSLLLLGLGAVLWLRTAPPERAVQSVQVEPTYGDFTVQTVNGPLALSSLKGKAVIVYFGYLSCPDICPTTLATLGAAFRQLDPEQQQRATVVMVSVDPQRDTVERIADYVTYFGDDFLGGTADKPTIDAAATDWGVVYRKVESPTSVMAYTVDHSTQSFLVGPDGTMVELIAHGTDPKVVAERIRAVLAE